MSVWWRGRRERRGEIVRPAKPDYLSKWYKQCVEFLL
jgi:hypothetical protein